MNLRFDICRILQQVSLLFYFLLGRFHIGVLFKYPRNTSLMFRTLHTHSRPTSAALQTHMPPHESAYVHAHVYAEQLNATQRNATQRNATQRKNRDGKGKAQEGGKKIEGGKGQEGGNEGRRTVTQELVTGCDNQLIHYWVAGCDKAY